MPMDIRRYPQGWRAISLRIRERADNACECIGECGGSHPDGRCNAPNRTLIERDREDPAKWRVHTHGSACLTEPCGAIQVILTVAHLDHDSSHSDPARLKALCQRCHLKLDAAQHAGNARETRMKRKAVSRLPGVE